MSQAAHLYLVHRSLNFRSTTVQKCGRFFNRFTVRAINQMRVVVESNAGIRVAELPLRDFRSGSRLKENCGVHVPKRVEACPRDLQCIAQWPQPLLNNLAGRAVRPARLI